MLFVFSNKNKKLRYDIQFISFLLITFQMTRSILHDLTILKTLSNSDKFNVYLSNIHLDYYRVFMLFYHVVIF